MRFLNSHYTGYEHYKNSSIIYMDISYFWFDCSSVKQEVYKEEKEDGEIWIFHKVLKIWKHLCDVSRNHVIFKHSPKVLWQDFMKSERDEGTYI